MEGCGICVVGSTEREMAVAYWRIDEDKVWKPNFNTAPHFFSHVIYNFVTHHWLLMASHSIAYISDNNTTSTSSSSKPFS